MIAPSDLPESVVQAFINTSSPGLELADRSKTIFLTKLIAGLGLYTAWTYLMIYLIPMSLPLVSLIVQLLAIGVLLSDLPRVRLLLTLKEDEITMTRAQTIYSVIVAIAGFPVMAYVLYEIYRTFHNSNFMIGLRTDARRDLVMDLMMNVQYWNAGIALMSDQDGPNPFRADLIELALRVHGSLSRSEYGHVPKLEGGDAEIMSDIHLWRDVFVMGVGKDRLLERIQQVYSDDAE